MQFLIGLSPDSIQLATDVPAYRIGTMGSYDHPTYGTQVFVYGLAGSAFSGPGYLGVEYGTHGQFAQVTTANCGYGNRLAAAQVAMSSGQYGWFQVYGRGNLRTLASMATQARPNTTATAGAVDDDGTAASKSIIGVTLLVSTGGAAAANNAAVFNFPVTGPVL